MNRQIIKRRIIQTDNEQTDNIGQIIKTDNKDLDNIGQIIQTDNEYIVKEEDTADI